MPRLSYTIEFEVPSEFDAKRNGQTLSWLADMCNFRLCAREFKVIRQILKAEEIQFEIHGDITRKTKIELDADGFKFYPTKGE